MNRAGRLCDDTIPQRALNARLKADRQPVSFLTIRPPPGFVIDRAFMKLFRTNEMDTGRQCQQCFNFELPSVIVSNVNRAAKFESQFIANCNNVLYCNSVS